MKYDYVDIGTSDFDTSSGMGKVLLVEPLSYYLDRIPEVEGTKKINCAISDKSGTESIFYVPESVIDRYRLPSWTRGCNSLAGPHPNVIQLEKQHGVSLAIQQDVDVITFRDLLDREKISAIGTLKIDTEGHDHIILRSVIEVLPELNINSIIFEYKKDFANLDEMNKNISQLRSIGYSVTDRYGDNVRMDKTQLKAKHSVLRVAAFTYPEWAFGSLHSNLAKNLYSHDVDLDILSWRISYSYEEMQELAKSIDLFMTTPEASPVLLYQYKIDPEQIAIVGHSIFDFWRFQQDYDIKELGIFRNIGVVSSNLKTQVQALDLSLDPVVLPLGVNYAKFSQEPATKLNTIGYAGKFHRDDNEKGDWKRGFLVQRIADKTGLPLKVAESYHNSYVTMPGFYSDVDCVIISSNSNEAAGLPALEAAASGRLVLSTPVGHILERGGSNCADLLPIEENALVDTAVELINRYRNNPELFSTRCSNLQLNAQQNDWSVIVSTWADFMKGRKNNV